MLIIYQKEDFTDAMDSKEDSLRITTRVEFGGDAKITIVPKYLISIVKYGSECVITIR